MIVLGIVLIVLGLLLPSLVPTFAFAHICVVIGVILLVVGLLLMVAGTDGTRCWWPPSLLLTGQMLLSGYLAYSGRARGVAESGFGGRLCQRPHRSPKDLKRGNDGDY